MPRILASIGKTLAKGNPRFEFDEYVSHWDEASKNQKDLSVSPETVGSREWLALAEGQFELLKRAGLRKDWIIVEIGFGNGKIAHMLEREKAIPNGAYYGFDIIHDAVAYAKRKFTTPNLHFSLLESSSLNLPHQFADCVFLFSVFTHVDEAAIREYLKQIRRILKPSGLCIFSIHVRPDDQTGQITIPIAQYSVKEIEKIVWSLNFNCYKFAKSPDVNSAVYLPGRSPDKPYGVQFIFVVSTKQLNNSELTAI